MLLALLLTLKEALDLHCRLDCKEDGELGGEWSEKEKSCVCRYVKLPTLKIKAIWPELKESPAE